MKEINKIYFEDCLIGMQEIDARSIDMILCDLPYGSTACKWDVVIPFEPLWAQYERIIKDNGAIVLTASQPFTSALVMSNPKLFRYEWIWDKKTPTGFLNCHTRPLKSHENILVFSKKTSTYNPQKYKKDYIGFRPGNSSKISGEKKKDGVYGENIVNKSGYRDEYAFPKSIIQFPTGHRYKKYLHPTQKPVELFEYLIKTYTQENELVLDNCIGSGTTAIACINTKRNYLGFENDLNYYTIASNRIKDYLCNETID